MSRGCCPIQTRVLEANLMMGQQQVAGAILTQDYCFRHYDKAKIAALCEGHGLIELALRHYTELADIKRVVCNTNRIHDPQFLITWFGTLPPEWAMECLKELMVSNMRQNAQVVVSIATKYTEALGLANLIELFEMFKTHEGLFLYLGSVIRFTSDSEVIYKYIVSAIKRGQFKQVEAITREDYNYDPQQVIDFLKYAKLQDPRSLVDVCDKHGFADQLVKYFHANNQMKFIEQYALKVNLNNVPVVAATLMDLDVNEGFIKGIILGAGNYCPAEPLIKEMESRNRVKLILQWLESRVNEGSQDVMVHSAIAKVYVDTNNNPEHFLKSNEYYGPRDVGIYCEKRDPQLCVVAFTRGQCDQGVERVKCTNTNGSFFCGLCPDETSYDNDEIAEPLGNRDCFKPYTSNGTTGCLDANECHVGWAGDEYSCNDVDECASDPCTNGGTCTESSCEASAFPDGTLCDAEDQGRPPIDQYSCACTAGFAPLDVISPQNVSTEEASSGAAIPTVTVESDRFACITQIEDWSGPATGKHIAGQTEHTARAVARP
eukprot:SAG22_NODE_882_length_6687_cov_5.782332_3_plen_546_part_00